ncbi:ABC transporter [Paxillus ammoniavirescens]|nr:ABC transporter [Paxillus ammoniavirescens]
MDESRLLSGSRFLAVVCALLLSLALIALDQTIIATALPVITSDFNALQDVTWIVGGYLLTTVSFMLAYGQALAIFPTKTVCLFSIVMFELGSLFCGIAPSVNFLIFGRAFAGIGAAGISVSVLTIMAESTAIRFRAIVFGAIGALFSLSSIIGPLIGGSFTTRLTWRWCFYINLPLGATSYLVIFFSLPLHKPLAGCSDPKTMLKRLAEMDWIGCLLCLATMVALVLPLLWGSSDHSWRSPVVIALICVFAILLATLLLWEWHKAEKGILPLKVLARRSQMGASIVAFFTMFNMLMLTYYIPMLYQAVYDHSPIRSGIDMLPFLLSSVVTTISTSVFMSQTGHYWTILTVGPVFSCVAGGLLFTTTESTSAAKLIGYQILCGIGVGSTIQNAFTALQADTDPESVSVCSAIASFMQILGGFIGVTIAGVVFNNQLRYNLTVYAPDVEAGLVSASVAAIYSAVPTNLRPGVVHAYVRSLDCVFITAVPAGILTILGAALMRNLDLRRVSREALVEANSPEANVQTDSEKQSAPQSVDH